MEIGENRSAFVIIQFIENTCFSSLVIFMKCVRQNDLYCKQIFQRCLKHWKLSAYHISIFGQCFLIWFFSWPDCLQGWLQYNTSNGLFSTVQKHVYLQRIDCCARVTPLLACEGFSPEWLVMCFLSLPAVAKKYSHCLQLKGFSLECVSMCCLRLPAKAEE